ncbi:clostripain-related cysteine peptidase [Burkholderia pyrrocinia]|uniref:clostripain-related cysteine peptidase n=1 Tax=Burkholderia pyrrocinia TaxID=60550 RepID=UPI002AAFB2B0|nr:clostripain-related cysteine peptidase [Burkholderia pyrrocinia]
MKIILRGVRRHLLSIVGGFLIVFLGACGGGGDDIDSSASADRTLLVYMVGSNLTADAEKSLDKMIQATVGTRLNLVVTTGGGSEKGGAIDWSRTQRWLLGNGTRTKLADLGQQDMTRPDTLRDFLVWGIQNYPAKRYAVVLNDHGGGYRGFGFVGEAHMSLTDLVSAFDGAKKATGASFDLIGFDACLMASVEVAAALQPYGSYLAASEDIEYGPWDYEGILSGIANKPDLNGRDLGTLIADTYKKMPDSGLDFTFSITDLQQVPPLVAALNNFGSELKSGNYPVVQIAKIRSEAQSFLTDWMSDTDAVDLLQLSNGMANGLKPAMATGNDVIRRLVGNAVIYKACGTAREQTGGLSIFMPAGSIYRPELLNEYASLKNWMGAYHDYVDQYAEALKLSLDVAIGLTKPYFDGGAIFSYVTFPKYWKNSTPLALISYFDGNDLVYAARPVGAALPAVIEGVNVDPSSLLMVKGNIDGKIYTISKVPVSLIPTTVPDSGGVGRYVIPVMRLKKGLAKKIEESDYETGFILVDENAENGRLTMTGYVPSLGGAIGHATSISELGEGWTIYPSYWGGTMWLRNDGQSINSAANQWDLAETTVPATTYNLTFAVADFANRLHVSEPASFSTPPAGPARTKARVSAWH